MTETQNTPTTAELIVQAALAFLIAVLAIALTVAAILTVPALQSVALPPVRFLGNVIVTLWNVITASAR